MMRSVFGRQFQIGWANRIGPAHRARSRRLDARLEVLEARSLMTGGSVVQTGGLVTITPASTGANTAVVTYQSVYGTTMLDVNLNGRDHYFSLAQVGFVYYLGSHAAGAQTFENNTSLHSVAWGGSGTNVFEAGTGSDEFFGGSGSNTFDAGSGFDVLIGGTGANVFNESLTGSGLIVEAGNSNSINVPPEATGTYRVV
jgi:Ca2+-binding RTX toxin-like protein